MRSTEDPAAGLWQLLTPDERPVCGVEHEYEVRDPAGRPVDFRLLADGLGLGRRLDPGDPYAARGPWGGVVTVDGAEAEVVTPPVPVGHGAPDELHAWTAAGRDALADSLPPGHTVHGYSTHISVAVPDGVVRRVADLVVRHLSPALMLLLDRADSPGLLVRPRPGRLEVCGEYVQGPALRQAAAVVIAGAEWCTVAAGSRRVRGELPPALRLRTTPARQRFGTYVDRTAFGPDLYATGRAAVLRSRGGTETAGERLAAVVEHLDGRLRELLLPDDLADLRDVATGHAPLLLERADLPATDEPRTSPAPLDLRDRIAGAVRVSTVSATWWTYVLRLDSPGGTRWLTVPRAWLGSFLRELDTGRLDAALAGLCPADPGGVPGREPVGSGAPPRS